LKINKSRVCIDENFQNVNVYSIPAWDCLPYDISSPNFNIISERVKSFTKLSFFKGVENKNIILTTVNGLLIKTAPRNFYSSNFLNITKHNINSLKYISNFLSKIGYTRVETVRESGEFGIRGSILDLFPVGSSKAFRIDFIGDEIDSMKVMDPLTQRSSDLINNIDVFIKNKKIIYKGFCIETLSLYNFVTKLFEIIKSNFYIQRFKGLGEMNSIQLWETTLNPQSRIILRVKVNDLFESEEIFSILMGNKTDPRRNFLTDNSSKIKNIDL